MNSKDFTFKCINRFGDLAEYTKITEFKNKYDDFNILVFDDNGEKFCKYDPNETFKHLYNLTEEEMFFAVGTYNMLKNLALTQLHKQNNTSEGENIEYYIINSEGLYSEEEN